MLTLACVRRRPTWSIAAARTRSIAVPPTACCAIMAPKDKKSAHQARSAHYSSHIRVSRKRAATLSLLLLLSLLPVHSSPRADRTGNAATVQVVNVDNSTAAPSVLLFFDQHRYLFNAGEGIQRHFIEHKQRMNKVRAGTKPAVSSATTSSAAAGSVYSIAHTLPCTHCCCCCWWLQITHILATRVHTDTLAGLPGMLLSQVQPGADLGKPGGAAVSAAVYGEQRHRSAGTAAAAPPPRTPQLLPRAADAAGPSSSRPGWPTCINSSGWWLKLLTVAAAVVPCPCRPTWAGWLCRCVQDVRHQLWP